LLDSVNQQNSSSPDQAAKFQKSAFMGLMRQFKDGSADVKGEELVQQQPSATTTREGEEGWAQAFSTSQGDRTAGGTMSSIDKGKGRARDQSSWSNEFLDASTSSASTRHHESHPYSETYLYPQSTGYGHSGPLNLLTSQHHNPLQSSSGKTVSSWDAQFDAVSSALNQPEKLFSDQGLSDERLQHDTHVPGQSSRWEESLDPAVAQEPDLSEMQDEEVFGYYQGSSRMPINKTRNGQRDWRQGMEQQESEAREKMMDDWDAIGGAQTSREEGTYVFQEGNPWLDERWARIEGEGDAFQVSARRSADSTIADFDRPIYICVLACLSHTERPRAGSPCAPRPRKRQRVVRSWNQAARA
jgi:hypothetical protein